MNEFLVSTDSMGVIHLYDCNFQRPAPDRSWHGFRSYQDLSDFFTFGLRGPAPIVADGGVDVEVTRHPPAQDASSDPGDCPDELGWTEVQASPRAGHE